VALNLADLPPTRGQPMFDEHRPPLAGERRRDMPRRAPGPMPLPPGGGDAAPVLSAIDRHLAVARRTGQHLAVLAVRMVPAEPPDGDPDPDLAERQAQAFGQRLRARVRSTDTVLRLAPEEWVALLQPCRHAGALAARQRLLAVLAEPYQLGSTGRVASALIGCACHPAGGAASAPLLAAALADRAGSGPVPRR
jgi:predicted signal transduction protein with EAL and GGDEF domain